MTKEMMTTKEVAEYLNINEKQVYKLIQGKNIPATRITGKWTFPKRLVDEWILKSAEENIKTKGKKSQAGSHLVVMGSNDFALELLAHELARHYPEYSLSLSSVGSIGGLIGLGRGICHIAGSHLLDPASGRYNTPFLERYLPGRDVAVINLVCRELGLIVSPGNPLKIAGIEDLSRPGVTIVNRQQGSGTRVFFDAGLARLGIKPRQINGYEAEVHTHDEAALAVLSGSAEAAVGILFAAKRLGLDFVHLTRERYDLIIPDENLSDGSVAALLEILRSSEFKAKIKHMGGYDTADTGKQMKNS